jgi:tetratricopeptide (TPR) repeat protein
VTSASLLRRMIWPVAVLVPACMAAFSWGRLEAEGTIGRHGASVLYLPSGKYLKAMSLGFPEVMADAIYIWSIQYYSNYDTADRFTFLEHIYSGVITELDPHYMDPYLIGSLIMSSEAGDNEMALRLLDKGMAANPREWILPFEAGFTCFNLLKDYPRAAAYFEKAIAIPDAPGVVRRIHAEMLNKAGDKRASLAYWTEVHEKAEDAYVEDISWRHVHDLRIEIDTETLHAALEAWKDSPQGEGRYPRSLSDLQRAGLIAAVPLDPDGAPYAYDPATGSVRSIGPFRLYRTGGS